MRSYMWAYLFGAAKSVPRKVMKERVPRISDEMFKRFENEHRYTDEEMEEAVAEVEACEEVLRELKYGNLEEEYEVPATEDESLIRFLLYGEDG